MKYHLRRIPRFVSTNVKIIVASLNLKGKKIAHKKTLHVKNYNFLMIKIFDKFYIYMK